MPLFIPLNDKNLLLQQSVQLNRLGEATGLFGLGRKVYLIYDNKNHLWGVIELDFFQRILRCFNFFQETRSKLVGQHLKDHIDSLKPLLADNVDLTSKIEQIFRVKIREEKEPIIEALVFPSEIHQTVEIPQTPAPIELEHKVTPELKKTKPTGGIFDQIKQAAAERERRVQKKTMEHTGVVV